MKKFPVSTLVFPRKLKYGNVKNSNVNVGEIVENSEYKF